ncbi:cupin 2 barrel domain-containing protein [Fimbriimonas ginsengisoli Gsoil 348]|uniref:Cupin 2 barrel domain-containing protein n=2 Tax=Fimbriimonas ginsengisoli TaxID=1005039 RepID=A0A068NUC3_FIMGI|nr:cupin 2 barrel domain-containing protein [Fimbriimonas ginsengisoli Gsoil 348]
MTLLVWRPSEGIAEHVNEEMDVLVVGFAGEGLISIDDENHSVNAGQAILIPKGSKRSILALDGGFSHLNVHQRRKRLMPGLGTDSWKNRVLP